MADNNHNSQQLVFTYLQHRSAIGWLGMALPVVVYLVARVFYDTGLQDSISAYYHTGARNFFVGILFAIAAFMLSYNGPEGADRRAGWLTALTAVLVAIFPTQPVTVQLGEASRSGTIHVISAFLFFASLIYFCLVLFVKSSGTPTPEKLKRNRVYRLSGYTMAACILLIALLEWFDALYAAVAQAQPVFWLESIAIWAFGISWLTKGETLFPDK